MLLTCREGVSKLHQAGTYRLLIAAAYQSWLRKRQAQDPPLPCQHLSHCPFLLQIAQGSDVPVLLDCGGVEGPISPDLLRCLSCISPNETELARLTGRWLQVVLCQVSSLTGWKHGHCTSRLPCSS